MLGTNGEGWGHMISQPGYFVGSLKTIHKNMKLIQSFHICCDFDPIFTRINSARAVIGLFYHLT